MDPFFTTHGRAVARGMGLPTVQGMMAQHGGWLSIDTKVEVGTTVRLYFPLIEAHSNETFVETGMHPFPTARRVTSGRILIADDEVFVRDLVKKVFEKEGWNLEEACSHEEVLALADKEEFAFDIAILDLTMPGPSAEESIAAIQRSSPGTKILVTSGFNHNERLDRLTHAPGVRFIPKPFSPKSLLEKVDTIMAMPA
jgi:two-component system cell cycle sensor histidine kinase/response regulator CckA